MKVISFIIEDSDAELLKAAHHKRQQTKSDFIREAIRLLIEETLKNKKGEKNENTTR